MIYEFSPKQGYNGYDKPWAPGDGPNLYDGTETPESYFNPSSGAITTLGGWYLSDPIPVSPSTAYYLSSSSSAASFIIGCWDEEDTYLGYVLWSAGNKTFTTMADTAYIRMQHTRMDAKPISINYPSTLTGYYPYANICPISGYNIWDPTQNQMIQVYSGYVDAEARKLYLHPVYAEYAGEELVGPWISSMDEYTEEGTPTEGAFVIDFGGDVTEYDITDFMLQTLLDSLGIRRFITSGAMLLNSLMDQAQGRVRSEEELLNRSFPIHVIAIGKELPTNLVIKKPVSDVLPVLPGKTKI